MMHEMMRVLLEYAAAGVLLAVMMGVCFVCLQGMAWAWVAICDRIDRARISLRQRKRRTRYEDSQPRD